MNIRLFRRYVFVVFRRRLQKVKCLLQTDSWSKLHTNTIIKTVLPLYATCIVHISLHTKRRQNKSDTSRWEDIRLGRRQIQTR
ncbi:hypothetical protein HanIR_Chr09g0449391 [Helianthus annuus]|nr:hypothetical protein HanIR_Chr09g0449391 [Helianthus annuus]